MHVRPRAGKASGDASWIKTHLSHFLVSILVLLFILVIVFLILVHHIVLDEFALALVGGWRGGRGMAAIGSGASG